MPYKKAMIARNDEAEFQHNKLLKLDKCYADVPNL